jgi:antitoxin component YwqK of YwqJK toxin-antitoxin module
LEVGDRTPDEQVTTHSYARGSVFSTAVPERTYRELRHADGSWVKEGPAVHWSRDGKRLEEGSYLDGKRDGPWAFWNEDGSIDNERSGVYRNDVRIGPSPAGDSPVRPRPIGYTDRH